MKNKYNARGGYEKLLTRLLKENKCRYNYNFKEMTDYQLLSTINVELKAANCIPFNGRELLEIKMTSTQDGKD